jgi:hypothetical protein
VSAVTLATISGNSPNSLLQPGSSGEVIIEVNNPNTNQVHLVSVVKSGTITADAVHFGCSTTGVSFTDQANLSIAIPAGATNFVVRLSGAASMSSASLSACQGATFSIPVTITVHAP